MQLAFSLLKGFENDFSVIFTALRELLPKIKAKFYPKRGQIFFLKNVSQILYDHQYDEKFKETLNIQKVEIKSSKF